MPAPFSRHPEFLQFLDRTKGVVEDDRWAARNFLLDEGVQEERQASYGDSGAASDHAIPSSWWSAHAEYLAEQVRLPVMGPGLGGVVDSGDPDVCPETFRNPARGDPYSGASPGMSLLRLEELAFVAERGGVHLDEARRILQHAAVRSADADALLSQMVERSDLRPRFSGFWADAEDLFPESGPAPRWADKLRNRLGLGHLDPGARGGPIEVVLFRYDVRDLPAISGWTGRPLVAPTVLDGALSPWFCPAPPELPAGRTVSLDYQGDRPAEELLHPANVLGARHVAAVGKILSPVEVGDLPLFRGFHLDWLRELSGREDWASATDGDLP